MQNKLVALVTGANQGIGLQIARDLAARGVSVLVGSRDLARGEAAARSIGGDARAIQLDVTDAASIAAAAAAIPRLDILVNNAGISNTLPADAPLAEVRAAGKPSAVAPADLRRIFETNVFGVVAVIQAMLPKLRAAPAGRIVNVSSELGSLTRISDPANARWSSAYAMSKTALNGVTVAFANELAGTQIKVNSACPGHTATGLNHFTGTRSVQEAARTPVRLALLGDDGPSGGFFNDEGALPW